MANFVSNDNATSLMNAINSKKDTKPVEITYAEWIALTDEERAGTHYLITDVPEQSSGGHTIKDGDGTDMTQRTNLQFTGTGVTVTDNSTDDKTVVQITGSGGGIFYGTCTGEEANQIKAVTVSNEQNFELKVGSILAVKFDANNTYSATTENPVKLNVNNTGAKQIYGGNTATPTGTNTTYFGRLNYYNYYVYDGTYWVWAGSSADNNTTYTPQALGFGYAICSTAAATTAKVATLSGYSLVTNGIVSVKFTNSVPANATLNINNKGAKNIYYQGAKIVADVIKAGDIATFVYSGNYNLICIDRGSNDHIIVDASGTAVAQEPTMQFTDSHVSDDPTNEKTIVEVIKSVASADYSSETEDGLYLIPDGDGSVIEPASEDYVEVTADGVKTYATLLNEIATEMDFSKVRDNAYLAIILTNGNKNISVLRANYGTSVTFFQGLSESAGARIRTYYIEDSNSQFEESTGSSYSDKSTTKPANGTKITLYYGNKKAVVDLQTTANRCLYDSNTTVKQKIDIIDAGHTYSATNIYASSQVESVSGTYEPTSDGIVTIKGRLSNDSYSGISLEINGMKVFRILKDGEYPTASELKTDYIYGINVSRKDYVTYSCHVAQINVAYIPKR